MAAYLMLSPSGMEPSTGAVFRAVALLKPLVPDDIKNRTVRFAGSGPLVAVLLAALALIATEMCRGRWRSSSV
jgi:hypothetical protein